MITIYIYFLYKLLIVCGCIYFYRKLINETDNKSFGMFLFSSDIFILTVVVIIFIAYIKIF